MSTVAISVIIPVYNAEDYLEDCLSSLQRQSFPDFEVWLIDDGSEDGSGEICDNFQSKDKRFHVIHKTNGGVSSARNAALEQAQGEWICFVDSDDNVESDYLRNLYEAAKEQRDVLVIQGFNTITPRRRQVRLFGERLYSSGEIHLTFQKLNINRCGFPFGKLYNASIIRQNQIRFNPLIHYAEDVIFMLTYLCHVSAIQTIGGAEYNYYIRNNDSLSQRIFPFESEYACYETYLARITDLKQRFGLSNDSLKKVFGVISEYLLRRSIGSLYQKSTRKPRKERLQILRSITDEQIAFLKTYYREGGWHRKLEVWLLSKRYYYLCDMFNQCISLGLYLKQLIKQ